jgi:catechol 2,3-dioxygenase-like lactoylglutathione lyase family enzyme
MAMNAGGTTMLDSIAYVHVYVSDQDRALDFYTNVLGFKLGYDNPAPDGESRFLTVGLPGQDLQLVLWPGTPGEAQPLESHIPGAYTIDTGNFQKAYQTLKSRGVQFETEVMEYPWGDLAIFRDPDGNRLQLREVRTSN